MAWSSSPVFHLAAASPTAGGFDTSASPIDSSGADTIFVAMSYYSAVGTPTFSDSKSNSWNLLTVAGGGGADTRVVIIYAKNAIVGSGHYFTVTGALTFGAINVAGFSGGDLGSPFDVENGNTSSGTSLTSIQPGSVTPGSNNELVFTALSVRDDTSAVASINSSFSIIDSQPPGGGISIGDSTAYIIQTSAGAVNPTWSITGSGNPINAAIATFKAAAAVNVALTGVSAIGSPGTRSDDFNRADDSSFLGNPSDGGSAWGVTGNTYGTISNQGYASAVTVFGVAWLEANTPSAEVELTFSTLASEQVLVARLSDGSNFVYYRPEPSGGGIWKRDAGSNSSLAAFNTTLANGDKLKFTVDSSNLFTAYQNGVAMGSVTSSFNSTATKFGFYLGDTTGRIDNFSIKSGNLIPGITLTLTGVSATGDVGTLTPPSGTVIALTGVEGTGSVGAFTPSSTLITTGVQGSGSPGSLTAAFIVPITGVTGTGDVGTLTPSTATIIALTGVEGTGSVGSFTPGITKGIFGNLATGSVGDLSTGGSVLGITIDSPRILTPTIIGEVIVQDSGLTGEVALAGKSRVHAVAYAANVTLDCSLYDVFDFAPLTGNVSITLANASDGQKVEISIPQDSGGGHSVSFVTTLIFGTDVTGLASSTAANVVDEYVLRYKASIVAFRVLAVSHAYTN